MDLGPLGKVGRHPDTADQLFLVVQGQGWVECRVGQRFPIATGQAAFWEAQEELTAGTDPGPTAFVIEGTGVDPD